MAIEKVTRKVDAATGHSSADENVERALGQVLRAGVILAVLLAVLGAVRLLVQSPDMAGRVLIAHEAARVGVSQIFVRAYHGDGAAIILLGLLVLLATPVFRVASMIVAFGWEKDWLFAAISVAVLCVLVFGIGFAR
jgi:uncharacterized membrane protein